MAQDFYANSVSAAASIGDIVLSFKKQAPVFNENGSTVDIQTLDEMVLLVSPSLAKGLMNALANVIGEYETKFGPIPLTEIKRTEAKKQG